MSFFEHKIQIEFLVTTWSDKKPEIPFDEILELVDESKGLLRGSASMMIETLGMLKIDKTK